MADFKPFIQHYAPPFLTYRDSMFNVLKMMSGHQDSSLIIIVYPNIQETRQNPQHCLEYLALYYAPLLAGCLCVSEGVFRMCVNGPRVCLL